MCTEKKNTHNEQIKEMRDEKVHKEGQTKKYQGEKKEKRKGGGKRSLCGSLDQEY